MKRVNESLETYKNLVATREALVQKELDEYNAKVAANESFVNQYHMLKDKRAQKDARRATLMEAARNDAFGMALKAIYITALEAHTLTDNGIVLAESMVDSWIKENGGASKILSKTGNKTYLLSRITQLVEDAAQAAVDEIESDAEDLSVSKKKAVAVTAAKEFLKDASSKDIKDFMGKILSDDTPKEEKPAEEPKAEEVPVKPEGEESKDEPGEAGATIEVEDPAADEKAAEEPKPEDGDKEGEVVIDTDDDEGSKEPETSFDDNPAEPEGEEAKSEEPVEDEKSEEEKTEEIKDETDEELGEPLDDDEVDQDVTIDGDTENEGELLDELDKEEDVQKAVEIIRSRISDAEETFIKNNAEDKKKIEELLAKISTNVKTVEDLADKDETKAQIAEESVRMYKRQIDAVKEGTSFTVFEKMARNLSKNIVKNEIVRESYITESGTLDTDLIVESAKVMYGFLETINTLQLEKVDSNYIQKVLDSMD